MIYFIGFLILQSISSCHLNCKNGPDFNSLETCTCSRPSTRQKIYLSCKIFSFCVCLRPLQSFPLNISFGNKTKNSKQRTNNPHQKMVPNGKQCAEAKFTWRHGGYVGAPKQRNGGQVGVPHKSSGNWVLFICKIVLLFFFRLKNMAREWMLQNNICCNKYCLYKKKTI